MAQERKPGSILRYLLLKSVPSLSYSRRMRENFAPGVSIQIRVPWPKSSVAASQFLLKVSPKNNGSQHLVLGTEELLPNAQIAKHKHLVQDEILLVQSGTAHVWLGD